MSEEVDDFLAHYGVRGMKWGKRNSKAKSTEDSEPRKRTPEEKKALAKKIAIGTGALLVAAGAAYAVYSLNAKGKTKVSNLTPSPKAKAATASVLKEPTDIIYASRGLNKGFRVFKNGNSPSPIEVMDKAFGGDLNNTDSSHFQKTDGRVAATFLDPEGRKDRAGRVIPHMVVVPKTMSTSLNNLDDVVQKIWPIIKDTHSYE